MKLGYVVQHLEGRDAPLERLLVRLPPAVVVTDPLCEHERRSPMRNYLRCLAVRPKGVTHLVVLQDDAVPCRDFHARVLAAVSERPDTVVSLFVGGLPSKTRKEFLRVLQRGERWVEIWFREIHHVVGLVWPVGLADEFLGWYETAKIPGPVPHRSDDAVVGFWSRTTKNRVWATVPCLVEHPDDVPSTVHSLGRQGDKGRRAIVFADDLG